MSKPHMKSPAVEPATNPHHHLLCWKSVFAGVLIAFMGYITMMALGAGIGGLTAESMIHHEKGGMALATGAGLWMGFSAIVALFAGSYFTLRISRFLTPKVGAAHGFVVASIFFILMLMGAGSTLGSLSMGLGQIADSLARGAGNMATNASVQDSVNRVLGSTALKSPAQEVAQGLAVRLLEGDTVSAKSYYAYQTGLPQADVDAKINQLKADFDANAKMAAEKTAIGIADTGWALFVLFLVGLIAAVMGGRVGAHSNVERPFSAQTMIERDERNHEFVPAHGV